MLRLDHLVVSAVMLDAGTAHVENLLGVPLETGGQHGFMGTYNTLLSLGPDCYLEVISIDPSAQDPGRARWFGLDQFSGPPRLTNWVCRSDDIATDLASAPDEMGEIFDAARGDLRWQMALTKAGQYPYGGVFPGMIQWQGSAHPAQRLPDRSIRLKTLALYHPDAEELAATLTTLGADERVTIKAGSTPRLVAIFQTNKGEVQLG